MDEPGLTGAKPGGGKLDCGPGVLIRDPGRQDKFAAILYVPAADSFFVLRGASLDPGPETPEEASSMFDPTAAAAAAETDTPRPPEDWPRPGDVGYVVADWGADVEALKSTLDELRRELRVFFVPDRNGALHYVESGRMTDLDSPQSATATRFTPDEVKRTLAESLRESAKKEREYGAKCVALADTLERLAAESEEGGNGDG